MNAMTAVISVWPTVSQEIARRHHHLDLTDRGRAIAPPPGVPSCSRRSDRRVPRGARPAGQPLLWGW